MNYFMRIAPFGNQRINACLQLPAAYRRKQRPSSALNAKAFTLRSSLLYHLFVWFFSEFSRPTICSIFYPTFWLFTFMSLFLLTRSFHLHLLSLFCFQAALFSVLFQEQISTDDLFHLLIFALASKTFAFFP